MDMPVRAGDPLTPGYGSEPGGKKIRIEDAETILKIPVLPISYGDAPPILRQLKGKVVPNEWKGALPFTYHVGPGPAQVHMNLRFEWKNRPLYNVVARIPGTTRAGRVDHLRQPPRCVGERRRRSDQRRFVADGNGARPRRNVEDRLASVAHDRARVVGR